MNIGVADRASNRCLLHNFGAAPIGYRSFAEKDR